jgi:Cof subfamily protein (haloacid dehalogenase superfamily)
MTYKMIAIDLDGTLLSPLGHVTDRTKAAVHRCLRAGILVCFATGRNWTESRTVLDAIEHYASAVFAGGSMVVDTGKRVTIHRTKMNPELARDLCSVLEDDGHAVLALQDTHAAGVDYLVSGDLPMNAETRRWMRATNAAVTLVPRLSRHDHPHTIRLSIVAPSEQVQSVKTQIDKRFAERIFGLAIRVPNAGVDVYEIFDPAVNKWEGILHVARRHNIDPAHIIAIGDDLNDVPMIRQAGLGVAMGNARPEVKQIAARIIGSNEEDGLARFLEELVVEHAVEPLADSDAA